MVVGRAGCRWRGGRRASRMTCAVSANRQPVIAAVLEFMTIDFSGASLSIWHSSLHRKLLASWISTEISSSPIHSIIDIPSMVLMNALLRRNFVAILNFYFYFLIIFLPTFLNPRESGIVRVVAQIATIRPCSGNVDDSFRVNDFSEDARSQIPLPDRTFDMNRASILLNCPVRRFRNNRLDVLLRDSDFFATKRTRLSKFVAVLEQFSGKRDALSKMCQK